MTIKLGKNFDTSKALKNLVRGYKLVPHIDRALAAWDETGFTYASQRKEEDDAWHPSGDCTPSLNALYHRAVDPREERKLAPSSVKNFQVGHFWHQWLQWIVINKLGFAESKNVERKSQRMWNTTLDENGHPQAWHWVTGSADIAPVSIPTHGDFLVDFKTMNARHYNQSGLPDTVADKWECQVNIYMDFFDLDRALVVGICKDTPHEMKEFQFNRNKPLVNSIYDKWHLVSECIDKGIEPPEDEEFHLPLQGPVEIT